MGNVDADCFLQWCNTHAQYLILAEPTHNDFVNREYYFDSTKQLIFRHHEAYTKKFDEHGLKVLNLEHFAVQRITKTA